MNSSSFINTVIGKIEFLPIGILKVSGNSGINITMENMLENDRAFEIILKNNKAPFLVLFVMNTTIDDDAREYFSSSSRRNIKTAEALVTPQLHHKLIVKQHLNIHSIHSPTKNFKTESEALEWLKQFIV